MSNLGRIAAQWAARGVAAPGGREGPASGERHDCTFPEKCGRIRYANLSRHARQKMVPQLQEQCYGAFRQFALPGISRCGSEFASRRSRLGLGRGGSRAKGAGLARADGKESSVSPGQLQSDSTEAFFKGQSCPRSSRTASRCMLRQRLGPNDLSSFSRFQHGGIRHRSELEKSSPCVTAAKKA